MPIDYDNYYSYSKDILVRHFYGKVDVNEIINSWKFLLEAEKLVGIKGVINDLTKAQLELDFESFKKLIEFLKSNKVLRNLKLAVVTDSPRDIVFPSMAELIESDIFVKPFSTMKAALEWLLNQ